ncbi:MAG: peptidoglycan DD-metalloendopeptidase family protein [Rikenellaceae bacterium]|jgi:septal ring factor EnvC (AmiA/AmiB activator)|nr:peptidoglycan DD-metalloendopeptidase family protein [Rikenellaceae bacterium]
MRKIFSISIIGLVLVAVLLPALPAAGQKSVESLKSEIALAEEEIRQSNALLGETRRDQASGQRELKLIQSRISSREKIVEALGEQIGLLDEDLTRGRSVVTVLNKERTKLKDEYAVMIRESYKNYLLNNYLAFLFASKDFNDITRRLNYMRRYNDQRERKAARIDSLSGVIAIHMVEVDLKKAELDKTKTTQTAELTELGKDKKQYLTTLANLKVQEGKISREISAKRAQVQRAQQEIARMVAAEAKKTGKKPMTAEQQRDAVALTGRFDQNRGKLPWPVRGGVIIDHYGLHAHPTQKGLTVDNKGVNIAGARNAEIRCVFEGVVANIFFYQGLNNNVMVRHGSYLTVYSNLASMSVKVGDKVSLNQVLGRLPASGSDEDLAVHFEVWKESENLNPESWLMP